jgi:hypothetical protein
MALDNWTIGHLLAGSAVPDHEESIGDNWWMAAHRLNQVAERWAAEDDRVWQGQSEGATLAALRSQWESNPPVHDLAYELTVEGHCERRTFYLTGRP